MSAPAQPAAAPHRRAAVTLAVPDVTGQAYVFAKGMLEDAGFAWRVAKGSNGYAGYRVVAQSPEGRRRAWSTPARRRSSSGSSRGGRYNAQGPRARPGLALRRHRDPLPARHEQPAPSVPKATKPAVKPHAAKPTTHKAAATKPPPSRSRRPPPKKRAAAKPATRTPAFVARRRTARAARRDAAVRPAPSCSLPGSPRTRADGVERPLLALPARVDRDRRPLRLVARRRRPSAP